MPHRFGIAASLTEAFVGAHCPQRETSRTNGTKFGRPRKVDDAERIATAKKMKADITARSRFLESLYQN